ncbi:hypothetical protein N9B88_03460 [Rubripirellula sp.]|jgi:hypothetical protein|nr:hypothetical protein [Rubripirellula sp.]
MSRVALILALVFCFIGTCKVYGQSTISNRPLELSTGQGLWGAWLPKYARGETLNDGGGIVDDMALAGYHGDLKLVRRFLGTRTSFESRVFYATAESTASGANVLRLPSLVSGTPEIVSNVDNSWRLKSGVENYGFDLSLRDTWVTRFGGLSAGCAFSYIAFDQTFNSTIDNSPLLREELDADYRGGKAFVGWDGCFRGNPANLDLLVGFYDMNADYDAGSTLQREMTKNVTTIEANFTTRRDFREIQVGATLGLMYLTDMPMIEHNVNAPVSIGTDDAFTLKFLFEILL